MSKSNKKKPTPISLKPKTGDVPVSETSRPVQLAGKKPDAPVADIKPAVGGFELIRVDSRLKWFLGVCIGLFVLFTLAKIHPISLSVWNQLLPDGSDAKRGLISGTPRTIRMDDYAVGTPWILSQVNRDFPVENETIGGEKAPILTVPTRHFSALFRPELWGFFLVNTESAYAWVWNIRICLAVIGVTLMLLLLTRNNFWLSVFGSFWLLLSSGTQSWTYIPASMIAGASLIFVAAVYLLFSQNRLRIIVAAIALAWLLMYYALILYPPYEVPMGYVLVALLLGYIINQYDPKRLLNQWPVKLVGGVLALAVLGSSFYLYYQDVKPTLDAIMNTVYPGRRSELGGTGFIANWFSEYFSWAVQDTKFPKNWLNHCELSHYITFAPIIIPGMIAAFVITRKIDWALLLLGLFVIVGYLWIEVGFPEWLAKATLFSMSPTRRTQIPFGIANVLLTVLYLHYLGTHTVRTRSLYTALSIAGVLAFMIFAAQLNINDSDGFFKWHQLFLPVLFFTGLGTLLLVTWQPPYRNLIFCGAMVVFLLPNFKLNPVSKGLAPITQHALYRAVQDIHQREPQAKWVVYGSQYVSYLVTATGVDLLSGVKYIPPRKILKVLDPQMKRDSAYNRYAHTVYNSYIDGRDTVIIQNTFEDGYQVLMDPCSPKFKQLNVKYIVFDRQPQAAEIRCMKPVTTLGSLQIYRIND
ncbi:DUF7657 domain-containing protein [Larkinella rosea]|uniref:DUF7657 domain-containing protein n=1 Tax=Larkinella rosea TaxID=2025312 RepID=UPI001E3D2454|nr:hypothetical protein [Larkinella rosea]